jgi:hypothetical protein
MPSAQIASPRYNIAASHTRVDFRYAFTVLVSPMSDTLFVAYYYLDIQNASGTRLHSLELFFEWRV